MRVRIETVQNECSDALRQINAVLEQIESNSASMEDLFRQANAELQLCESKVAALKAGADSVERQERLVMRSVDALLEDIGEMEKVASWYRETANSYAKLKQELERREAFESAQRRLIASANAQLRELARNEAKQRDDFEATHAQYLPENLYPAMKDRPRLYQVQLN